MEPKTILNKLQSEKNLEIAEILCEKEDIIEEWISENAIV